MGKKFSKTYQPKKNGRPVGSISLHKLIRQVWSEEITDDKGNPKIRALLSIKALIEKAEKGDVHAFRALSERMEGMPKQEIHQTIEERLEFKEMTNEELRKEIEKYEG